MKQNGGFLVLFMTAHDLYSNHGGLEGMEQREIFLLNEYEVVNHSNCVSESLTEVLTEPRSIGH